MRTTILFLVAIAACNAGGLLVVESSTGGSAELGEAGGGGMAADAGDEAEAGPDAQEKLDALETAEAASFDWIMGGP